MKILVVTPMPPRPNAPGAIPMVLYAQLVGLRERHDVTLATVAGPDPDELAAVEDLAAEGVPVHVAERRALGGRTRWRRRTQRARGWAAGLPWRTVWFWEPGMQEILDRLLDGRRFDVVVAEDNACAIYRYRTTAPTVLTEHETRRPRAFSWRAAAAPSGWALLRELDWQRWPRYERRVWPRFDRIHVFSPRDAGAIHAICPGVASRVRVTPFGIAPPPQAPPGGEEQGLLLFTGNFTHPPNVDAALWLGRELMPLLSRKRPDARLAIVGPGAPPAVRALQSERIDVPGQVDDVAPYVRRAAVVVAPVRIGGGMRMKVLEAMAFGKAVVTTERGADGLRADGVETPLRIAESAADLAEAIAGLLADEHARHRLGARARAFALRHHSPQAYADRLEESYAELVAAPRAGTAARHG